MDGSAQPAALAALLTTYRPALESMLARRIPRQLRGVIGAEDVAQEAALEALRSIGAFRPDHSDSMRRWVRRIALHRLCDVIKAQGRRKRSAAGGEMTHEGDIAAADDRAGPDAGDGEALDALRRALSALPRPYRRALELRYIEQLPVADAAQRLGRSSGAVLMLCNRGLKRLREEMTPRVAAAPLRSDLKGSCEARRNLSIKRVSGPSGPARNSTHSNGATIMKTRKTSTPSDAMPFEPLEGRQLLSASLSGTTLTVSGSPGNDTIQVTMSYGPLFNIVSVYENGVGTGSFIASSVANINVYGNAGNDTIAIGSGIGRTYLNGGDGDDRIYGGNADDSIQCGNGNDYAFGGFGNDYIDGWYGNDVLDGGEGNDSMLGYYGDDTLNGQGGNDYLSGEAGSDWLTGGSGQDNMYGGDGNDFFTANDNEHDNVDGGAGWDTAAVDKKAWWEFWATEDSVSNVENAFEP